MIAPIGTTIHVRMNAIVCSMGASVGVEPTNLVWRKDYVQDGSTIGASCSHS